jgi:hypothetical protein
MVLMSKKSMSGKRFILSVLAGVSGLLLLIVGINWYLDIYGLFRPVQNRKLPIYHAERISKYLLSYNYIPQNFQIVLLGTSLSDNLDFSLHNDTTSGQKIYNASMMGANITEIRPVVSNLLKGGVRHFVICVSPYLTKNYGAKEVEFDDKLYYGALGSKNLYETYVVGAIRHFSLMPSKFPKNQIDANGVNDYGSFFEVSDVKKRVIRELQENTDAIKIDSAALIAFASMINELRDKQVRPLVYFHPVPYAIFKKKEKDFEHFQQVMRAIIQDDQSVINLNSENFRSFTSDFTNYIDHAHLSKKGQARIVDTLLARLKSH